MSIIRARSTRKSGTDASFASRRRVWRPNCGVSAHPHPIPLPTRRRGAYALRSSVNRGTRLTDASPCGWPPPPVGRDKGWGSARMRPVAARLLSDGAPLGLDGVWHPNCSVSVHPHPIPLPTRRRGAYALRSSVNRGTRLTDASPCGWPPPPVGRDKGWGSARMRPVAARLLSDGAPLGLDGVWHPNCSVSVHPHPIPLPTRRRGAYALRSSVNRGTRLTDASPCGWPPSPLWGGIKGGGLPGCGRSRPDCRQTVHRSAWMECCTQTAASALTPTPYPSPQGGGGVGLAFLLQSGRFAGG